MFKYSPDTKSMRYRAGKLLEQLLELVGMRSLDAQFMFSYVIIFVLTAVIGAAVYLSDNTDASAINVAGAQRMLSQKMAKEVLLLSQDVGDRSGVTQTMNAFESAHQALLNGSAEYTLEQLSCNAEPVSAATGYRLVAKAGAAVADTAQGNEQHRWVDGIQSTGTAETAAANRALGNRSSAAADRDGPFFWPDGHVPSDQEPA
jgi:methyl-accepting chemotaxis protein